MTTNYLAQRSLTPGRDCDGLLLDLDGVVYRGSDAVPHAATAIAAARSAGLSVMYVTNNASRSPQTVADHLCELGIPTASDEVTTAAQAAAALIAADYPPGTAVLVIGGAGLRQAVTEVGMTVVDSARDRPAVVVQGFAPELGWAQLTEAVFAINAGAEHIASNLDATLPMERGMALGNGSLVAAVANATGVKPRSTGKPAAAIFGQAARRAGMVAPLVVGDRLDTDLEGARAAGYQGMHVLTGVDGPWQLLRCIPAQRPTMLALDLRGIFTEHPSPLLDGDVWRCRDAWARVVNDTVWIGGESGERPVAEVAEIDLDQLRAACAAAWSASDTANVDTMLSEESVDISVRSRPCDIGAIA